MMFLDDAVCLMSQHFLLRIRDVVNQNRTTGSPCFRNNNELPDSVSDCIRNQQSEWRAVH